MDSTAQLSPPLSLLSFMASWAEAPDRRHKDRSQHLLSRVLELDGQRRADERRQQRQEDRDDDDDDDVYEYD